MDHRDRSHRAHARLVVESLGAGAGASNVVDQAVLSSRWPQVERAQTWLAAHAEDDETAAALACRLLVGQLGLEVQAQLDLETRADWLEVAVRGAMAWGMSHEEMLLTGCLGQVRLEQRQYVAAAAMFSQAMTLGSLTDDLLFAQDLEGLATAYGHLGDHPHSEAWFATALDRFSTRADSRGILITLLHRAGARLTCGDPESALRDSEAALDASRSNDFGLLRPLLLVHARCLIEAHEFTRAAQLCDTLRARASSSIDRSSARLMSGALSNARGRFDVAAAQLGEAWEALGIRPTAEAACAVLKELARAHRGLGELGRCLDRCQERLVVAGRDGKRGWEAVTDLAGVCAATGDRARARRLYDDALGVLADETVTVVGPAVTTIVDRLSIAETLLALAMLDSDAPGWDGWAHAEEAITPVADSLFLTADMLDRLGQRAYDRAAFQRAVAYQRRRAQLVEQLSRPRLLAHALGECADAHGELAEHAAAITLYKRVAELDREVGDVRDEAHALNNIGLNLLRQGDRAEGLVPLRRAIELASSHAYRLERAISLSNLALTLDAVEPLAAEAAIFQANVMSQSIRGTVFDFAVDRQRLPSVDDLERHASSLRQDLAGAADHAANREAGAERIDRLQRLVMLTAVIASLTGHLESYADASQRLGELAQDRQLVAVAAGAWLDLEALATVVADPLAASSAGWGVVSTLMDGPRDVSALLEVLDRQHERAARHGLDRSRMRACMVQAEIRLGTEEQEDVPRLLVEALGLARRHGDVESEIDILHVEGVLAARRRDTVQAVEAWERARYLAREHHPAAVEHLDRLINEAMSATSNVS